MNATNHKTETRPSNHCLHHGINPNIMQGITQDITQGILQNIMKRKASVKTEPIRDDEGYIVGSWNGKNIRVLQRAMNRAMFNFGCMLTPDGIPFGERIPEDLTAVIDNFNSEDFGSSIWGCDEKGLCLVNYESTSDSDDVIMHLDAVAEFVREKATTPVAYH